MIWLWTAAATEWAIRVAFMLLGGIFMYGLMYLFSPKFKKLMNYARGFRDSVETTMALQEEVKELRRQNALLEEQLNKTIEENRHLEQVKESLLMINQRQDTRLKEMDKRIDELFEELVKLKAKHGEL